MLPRYALLRPQTQIDRGHCTRMQVDKIFFYRQNLKHQNLRMPELRQEVGLWHPHAFPAGPFIVYHLGSPRSEDDAESV